MASEIKELNKQISGFEKRAKKIVAEGKEEVLGDIETLKNKMATIRKKSEQLSAATEEAWKISKKGLDDSWKDLSKAMKKAAKKFQ